MRILIFGTCYVDTEAKARLVQQWVEVNRLVNPDCDLLLVDSASPKLPGYLDTAVYQLNDNVGHLARNGQDGWGRAFCAGLQFAIDRGYDYVVHIEGDSLCRLPVSTICMNMAFRDVAVQSVPVRGTKRVERCWAETGLMFFAVNKLHDFIEQYDWRDGKRKRYPYTPEAVIYDILGLSLQMMAWKTTRDDVGVLTVSNVKDYDWITHTTPEIYDAFVKFVKSMDHPHQWYGGRTYAQHGDDLAFLNIFSCLRIDRPSYIDIGAHHPVELSNTALLYQRGSRGINVEANPALIGAFNALRPEDKNVCVAVGPQAGTGKLNRVNRTSGINSLLPIKGHGALMDTIDVPMMTADEIIDLYADGHWPDLLSLDAEGMDLDILRSIDFAAVGNRGKPKVICVEAVSPSGNSSADLRVMMTERDYFVHSWAGNNMIFVQRELQDWLR